MGAPSSSSERTRELAELRSRAYGPDADIDRDADALARLIELEELVRVDGPEAVVGTILDDPTPADAKRADAKPADATDTPDAREPWWRRLPLRAYILGALVVGLFVGWAVPALLAPHPVTTLQQAPIDGAPLDFQMYGIQAVAPVRYQSFHDLEVWSARTEQGALCIVVTTDAGEWITAGCAPEPLKPTADVNFFAGMRPIDGLELPDGSVLRFVLNGAAMEVWIAETVEDA